MVNNQIGKFSENEKFTLHFLFLNYFSRLHKTHHIKFLFCFDHPTQFLEKSPIKQIIDKSWSRVNVYTLLRTTESNQLQLDTIPLT